MKLISQQIQNNKLIAPKNLLNFTTYQGRRELKMFPLKQKVSPRPSFHTFLLNLGLGFLTFFLVSCSGGGSGNSSSSANATPPTEQECEIKNGVGKQTRSVNEGEEPGEWGLCLVVGCEEGYTNDDGKCHETNKICTLDELVLVSPYGLAGTKPYQAVNNNYGTCVLTKCDAEYTLDNETCNENNQACTEVDLSSVDVNASAGTKSYQPDSDDYGTCVLESCKTGYGLGDNGRCYPSTQDCTSDELTALHANNGNKNYQAGTAGTYGHCVPINCVSDYTFYSGNNACYKTNKPCTDRAVLRAIHTKTASQAYQPNTAGTYGKCTPIKCAPGYTFYNNICYENNKDCNNELMSLRRQNSDPNIATATKAYQSNTAGTYGNCTPASCDAGYGLHQGTCTNSKACTASELANVDTNAFTGIRPLLPNGSYGACVVQNCKRAYTFYNGACYETNKPCAGQATLTALHATTATQPYQAGTVGTYGTCVPTQCLITHTFYNGVCYETNKPCTGQATLTALHATTATQPYQAGTVGTYGSCIPATCATDYTLDKGTCYEDSKSCASDELAALHATAGAKDLPRRYSWHLRSLCAHRVCCDLYFGQRSLS